VGNGESSLWGLDRLCELGSEMECVEKIAEYLNYACRHHPIRIFFTVIFWYNCTHVVQNRAEWLLRTPLREGNATITATVRKVHSVSGPQRCAHRA